MNPLTEWLLLLLEKKKIISCRKTETDNPKQYCHRDPIRQSVSFSTFNFEDIRKDSKTLKTDVRY